MADLPGWPYWKVISITGQAGAGIDYQIKLEIGDSAGGDFHLEGHCTNFPQDIRITDNDGTTLLDHWVEDITSDPIVVHVKVDDDLGSNQDIRIYYGKNGETTASNGVNTFITFDDFEGAIVDTSIWDVTVTPTVSTNQAFQGSQSLRITHDVITKSLIHNASIAVKYWIYPVDADYMYLGLHGNSVGVCYPRISGSSGDIMYRVGSSWIDTGYNINKDTWNIIDLYNFDHSSHVFSMGHNNVEIADGVSMRSLATYDDQFSLSDDHSDNYIDCYIERKYNDPEPAFSSAGVEQSISVGWSNKIIGISSPGKVNGIAAGDISKIMGVA